MTHCVLVWYITFDRLGHTTMVKVIRALAVKVTKLYTVTPLQAREVGLIVKPMHASYDVNGNLVVNGETWVKVVGRD